MAINDPKEDLKKLPIREFQNILRYWKNPCYDDPEETFMKLQSSEKFQYNDPRFYKLIIKCLQKCIKECEDLNQVEKEYGKKLDFSIQIFRKEIGIPLKRLIFQFINFFIDVNEACNDSSAVSSLPKFIEDYPRVLRNCGDLELQLMYTEAVTRLFNIYSKQETGLQISTNVSVYESFMAIDNAEFDKSCRTFLNNFNKLENCKFKVYSFPCQGILFGKVLLKTSPTNLSWVDMNQGSMCISFCCDVSSDGEEECLIPIFLLHEEIKRVGCLEQNGVLYMKLELKKQCEDYNLQIYDRFNAVRGNSAAFMFDRAVDLQSLYAALEIIGLQFEKRNSQKNTPDSELNFASSSIPHKTSVANASVNIADSGFEDHMFEDMGHDVSKSQADPQETLSSSNASIIDNAVSIDAEELNPPLKQSERSGKVSVAVDSITCHECSRFQRSNPSCETEMDMNTPSRVAASKINEELPQPIFKRKCKTTKKRRSNSSVVNKHSRDPGSSTSEEHPDLEPLKPKRKWRRLASKKPNVFGVINGLSSTEEGKSGTDYDVEQSKMLNDASAEGNSQLSPLRKTYVNVAVQCTPTIIESSSKNSSNILTEACDKATMCSPSIISERSHQDIDSCVDVSPLNDTPSLEETKKRRENVKVIQELGRKLKELIPNKLAELAIQRNAGLHDAILDFQNVWENQSNSFIELERQTNAMSDDIFNTMQENTARLSNMQNQIEIGANTLLDGLNQFKNVLEDVTAQNQSSFETGMPEI